jgi:hypothetical protein
VLLHSPGPEDIHQEYIQSLPVVNLYPRDNQYIQQLLKYPNTSMPDKASIPKNLLPMKNFPEDNPRKPSDQSGYSPFRQDKLRILWLPQAPGRFPPDKTRSLLHQ